MGNAVAEDLIYRVGDLKDGFDRARQIYCKQMHSAAPSRDPNCPLFNRAAAAAMAMELLAREFNDNSYIKLPGRLAELPTSPDGSKPFRDYFLNADYNFVSSDEVQENPTELYAYGLGIQSLRF